MGNKECNCKCENGYMPTEINGVLKKSIKKESEKENENISNIVNSEKIENCSNISDMPVEMQSNDLADNKCNIKEKIKIELNEQIDMNNVKTACFKSEESPRSNRSNPNEVFKKMQKKKDKKIKEIKEQKSPFREGFKEYINTYNQNITPNNLDKNEN